jgi:hypothetical protein
MSSTRRHHFAIPTLMAVATLAACTTPPQATSRVSGATTATTRPAPLRVEPVLSVRHAGGSARSLYALGRYHDGMRQHDRAIDAYQRAIAIEPTHVESHNALGAALAQRGRLGDAELAFRRALSLDANLAHVQSNLGHLLMLAGNHEAAVAALKVALRLDPDNVVNRNNLREALKQWDVARGRTPEHHAASTTDTIQTPSPTTSPAPTTAIVLAQDATQATALPKLPDTVEVFKPVTTASVNLPVTTSTVASAEVTTINVARAAESTVRPAPESLATAGSVTPTAVAASPAPAPMVRVVSQPNVAALVQLTAPAATRLAVPTGLSLGGAAVVSLPAPVRAAPQPLAAPTDSANGYLKARERVEEPRQPSLTKLPVAPLPMLLEPPVVPERKPVSLRDGQSTLTTPPDHKEKKVVSIWRDSFSLELVQASITSASTTAAGQALVARGLVTEKTSVTKGQDSSTTVIYYQAGHRVDADKVAAILGIKSSQVRWSAQRLMDHDVRVVLAKDWSAAPDAMVATRTAALTR